MVSSLSSNQSQALAGLMDISSRMNAVNDRIQTGKAINSVADGPAAFLQAQRLNTRSNDLLSVNKSLDLTLSAIKNGTSALQKLKDDLKTHLDNAKSLLGTTESSGTANNPTAETVVGAGRTSSAETGLFTGAIAVPAVGKDMISASRKIFGAAAAPSTTSDGVIGVAATNTSLRIDFGTAAAWGASPPSITITAADSSTGSLADLTVGDIVKKINNGGTGTTVGGLTVQAKVNADGSLSLTAGATNFKARFMALNGSAATEVSNLFGYANNNVTAPTSSTFSGTAPSITAVSTPSSAAKMNASMLSRTIFDTDGNPANNAPAYDANTNSINGGSFAATGDRLAVKLTDISGNSRYLVVLKDDLVAANRNTTTGLAAQLNDAAAAAGYTDLRFDVDATTGNLKIGASASTVVAMGSGTGEAAAKTNADANGFGGTLGIATGSKTINNGTAVTAQAVSMIGQDSKSFQDGDQFSMALTDKTGNTKTYFFKAVSNPGSVNTNLNQQGLDPANPWTFSTMQELVDSVNRISTGLTASTVKSGGGANPTVFKLNLTLAADQSLTITQTANAGAGALDAPVGGAAHYRNSANALEQIFGSVQNNGASKLNTTVSGETFLNTNVPGDTDNYGKSITYTRNPGSAASDGDPRRLTAANDLAAFLDTVDSTVGRADLDGQKNVLRGTQADVSIDERGSSMRVGLTQAVNTTGLGFASVGGKYTLLQSGLATNTDVNTVVSALKTAMSTIDSWNSSLGVQTGTLTSTKTYNAAIAKTLGEAATNITSSDSTADSVEMSTLNTRYTLSTSALSLLNQSMGQAAQLLR